MSGSNTICTTTVLLETGMVPMQEPETVVRLEAPGGVVEARATCRDGRCESVEFTNVPCFAARLDAPLEVEGLGTLSVDVAYGGMFYAIADAAALGFAIEPSEARDLSLAGERIRVAAREPSCRARIRRTPPSATSRSCRSPRPGRASARSRATRSSSAPGRLDRSPTGTGLCARMAALHARGLMQPGDTMSHASVIGSVFDGRIVAALHASASATASSPPCADRRGSPACTSTSSTPPIRFRRAISLRTPGVSAAPTPGVEVLAD